MHRWLLLICVAGGCGRINFDEHVALTYREAVLADRPLGYWRLDDLGTVATDEVGLNDGAYNGGCTHQVAGALAEDADTATLFDGSSCTVSLGGGFAFPGTAAYTIELWVFTHVVVTYDGATIEMHVDAAAPVSEPDGRPLNAYDATLEVGGLRGVGNFVTGTIDEVAASLARSYDPAGSSCGALDPRYAARRV